MLRIELLLRIENCAGGLQGTDLGMASTCLPIQVHDRCSPSVLERRYAHAFGCIYLQSAPPLALALARKSVVLPTVLRSRGQAATIFPPNEQKSNRVRYSRFAWLQRVGLCISPTGAEELSRIQGLYQNTLPIVKLCSELPLAFH